MTSSHTLAFVWRNDKYDNLADKRPFSSRNVLGTNPQTFDSGVVRWTQISVAGNSGVAVVSSNGEIFTWDLGRGDNFGHNDGEMVVYLGNLNMVLC